MNEDNVDEVLDASTSPGSPPDLHDPTVVLIPDGNNLEEPPEASVRLLFNAYSRYQSFLSIGAGGVGRVEECKDPHLGRNVALKSLHPRLRENPRQRTRFVREARVMAQLEHPNIVPVHELGMQEDGDIYFTMKRIHGVALDYVLRKLRKRDGSYLNRYNLRHRLEIFIHICQAMAFAHARGVIHRDLKPSNILIGAFGEVLVTDWGLAKIVGEALEPIEESAPIDGEESEESSGSITMEGTVCGTPLYMSPEQAQGVVKDLTTRADLYSMGCILYELLTLKRTFKEKKPRKILELVVREPVVPARQAAPEMNIPRELEAICAHLLEKSPDARYADVGALLSDIRRYQNGMEVSVCPDSPARKAWKACRRHPVRSAVVSATLVVLTVVAASLAIAVGMRYQRLVAEADESRANGNELHEELMKLQEQLALMDRERFTKEIPPEEAALRDSVNKTFALRENAYSTAVILYRTSTDNLGNPRVRSALQEVFANRIAFAMASGNEEEAKKWLKFIRGRIGDRYGDLPPEALQSLNEADRWIEGSGALQLSTEPPGAELSLSRIDAGDNGVLVGVEETLLGASPANVGEIERGRYIVTAKLAEHPTVTIPVRIDRNEEEVLSVYLPESIPEGFSYVPAGPFFRGGEQARHFRHHEYRADGFFIQNHEVSFEDYLEFWLDPEGANRSRADVSRIRLSHADRLFLDAWDENGGLISQLSADLPVVGIQQDSAVRYCEWYTKSHEGIYRLPTADEWEKAARGVDGRNFVWGDDPAPGENLTVENRPDAEGSVPFLPPGSNPVDRSVYGVSDLAANVREWTGSSFPGNSPFSQIKGGSAALTRRFLYGCYASDTPVVPTDVGFRMVRELNDDSTLEVDER